MTTITLNKPIKGIGSQFEDGFDLAVSLWSLYGDRLLDHYYDMRPVKSDEMTPELQASIDRAQQTPKSQFYNIS